MSSRVMSYAARFGSARVTAAVRRNPSPCLHPSRGAAANHVGRSGKSLEPLQWPQQLASFRFASSQAVSQDNYSPGTAGTHGSVKSATYDGQRRMVVTEWDDGETTDFPVLWLRDNCQCPECFLSSSRSRLFLMPNLDINAQPSDVKSVDGEVHVSWSDGHSSVLTSSWLHERRFTEDARQQQAHWLPRKPHLWGTQQMQGSIPTNSYEELMRDDHALYDWLCALEETGIFLVQDAPTQDGVLRKLAERVAFLRTTNYGSAFVVKAKVDASNLAYTPASLGLHTDLPYYMYCPGMQMLACLQQVPTKGGDNQFADGFHVADIIRKQHPDAFRILTTTPVQFIDTGTDYYEFHKLYSSPVICLDDRGHVTRIAYNNQVRNSAFPIPADQVDDFYRALKLFDDLLYENHVTQKLQAGEIICFHNYRVLHGRTGYQALEDGERHLEGGYIDWDELFSRRRVLQAKLNIHN